MLKAVLFDMDGVLFDSMKNHAEAWYQTMCEHHGFVCDRTLFYLYEGSTGAQTIDALFCEQRGRHATEYEIETIYREKSTCFTQLGPAEAMSGAYDVLRKVGAMHLTPVLVTGSGQASLIDKLSREYPGVFTPDHIVSAKDCPIGQGKPHPYPYLMGLQKAGGIAPSEAIVVENAPMGVQAGHAAGIFTIGVNTGPLDPQVLTDAGADLVLGCMEELAQRFEDIVATHFAL